MFYMQVALDFFYAIFLIKVPQMMCIKPQYIFQYIVQAIEEV